MTKHLQCATVLHIKIYKLLHIRRALVLMYSNPHNSQLQIYALTCYNSYVFVRDTIRFWIFLHLCQFFEHSQGFKVICICFHNKIIRTWQYINKPFNYYNCMTTTKTKILMFSTTIIIMTTTITAITTTTTILLFRWKW